jgi:hypothetical protein
LEGRSGDLWTRGVGRAQDAGGRTHLVTARPASARCPGFLATPPPGVTHEVATGLDHYPAGEVSTKVGIDGRLDRCAVTVYALGGVEVGTREAATDIDSGRLESRLSELGE